MFILTTERLTWITVKVPALTETGDRAEQQLRCKVALVDYTRFQEILKAPSSEERAIMHEVIRDWDGVRDPTKQPVPFSPAALNQAFEQPMFVGAFFEAYFRGWRGADAEREGNSNGSPAAGPEAERAVTNGSGGNPATPTASA